MKIEFSQKAKKQLTKLPKKESKKIIRKVETLLTNPYLGKKLTGKLKEEYSMRAWPYRILYSINMKRKLISIEIIQHRQGVYK
ncbi:MAG: Addiction module toxin, RelE/StbE [Candidatus Gottesmanbacteria bacterium GW2011_GWA1_34_13]|uniref:Addiction module toxin, RelE/StbE n=1 Tax=Candidatus Gottesmanbacteria bacterium GW2011_GWA1_34_13 TaxID=1618434 RepID=A0A0G0AMP7_9BACT|nr:MAG: Addiction module toxin, RelE/StbE [Candidatus Gottesmanbacteria bacterium GW2011_GWA1_34_13]